jgi:hypothetical protein
LIDSINTETTFGEIALCGDAVPYCLDLEDVPCKPTY